MELRLPSLEQLEMVYERDLRVSFPAAELKPLRIIRRMLDDGLYRPWCLFDGEAIAGTVALKRMNDTEIELKSLYLLEKYHGRGLGRQLLETALKYAAEKEYKTILLDTKSSSEKAIRLYRKAGFVMTERYNNNENADVFMKLSI